MTVYLVSKKGRKTLFAAVKKIPGVDDVVSLETLAPGRIQEARETAAEDSFFFLDSTAFSDGDLLSVLENLAIVHPGRVGVFDPEGVVDDPAQVFFRGGVDYIAPALLSSPIPAERFIQLRDYLYPAPTGEVDGIGENGYHQVPFEVVTPEPPSREILSGRDWSTVRSGSEYTFWFLYAQLDDTDRFAVRTSSEYGTQVDQRFREQLLAEAGRFGGRIWMWKQYGGLLLFPYDGTRCMPIVPAVRLFMNRVLYTVERSTGKNVLSFRLAIHLGNTMYRDVGETGDVVSEDVNFVYHLGAKHTRPGELTMTRTAFSFVPSGLQGIFIDRGTFEGHEIRGMRRFLPGALSE